MSKSGNAKMYPDESRFYQIRLKGHLGPRWADWFEGMTITLTDSGETLLTGLLVDQAALHGVLKRVRDLAAPLVSVVCLDPGQADAWMDSKTAQTTSFRLEERERVLGSGNSELTRRGK
jgi:hypothetical protein